MNNIDNFNNNTVNKIKLFRMLNCLTKYYFYKGDDDDNNLDSWVFVGPFPSLKIAEKLLVELKNYNKENRSAGLSAKIIKKPGEKNLYFNTYHVAYNASLSKNKINKTLKIGNNPNEWIIDFINKLKPKYNGSDFTTNLPFMPNTLDEEMNKKVYVKPEIIRNKLIINNDKNNNQKLSKEEILLRIQEKKELERIKANEQKVFLENKKLEALQFKTKKQLDLEKSKEIKIVKPKEVVSKYVKVDKSQNDYGYLYDVHYDED